MHVHMHTHTLALAPVHTETLQRAEHVHMPVTPWVKKKQLDLGVQR